MIRLNKIKDTLMLSLSPQNHTCSCCEGPKPKKFPFKLPLNDHEFVIIYLHIIAQLGVHGSAKTVTMHP